MQKQQRKDLENLYSWAELYRLNGDYDSKRIAEEEIHELKITLRIPEQ